MAVVQVIENGGARLEVNARGKVSELIIVKGADPIPVGTIDLDAEDLKALIKRCRTVLSEIEG
jgi:hypothetical protein